MPVAYEYAALRDFGVALGEKVGLAPNRSKTQAEVLLEADLMGHTTHGFALLPGFLGSIETGAVRSSGEPTVISDAGATAFWDANDLPGTWVLSTAIEEACARASKHGVVTFVLKNTAHIAALGAYLRLATDRGFTITVMNSDPSMRTVVLAGAIEPQLAANPIAFGYPTEEEPVLIDISTSSVANGWVRRWSAEGRKLPGPWLLDANGNPTTDPAALFGTPRGSMLPLGGIELGHKGFALSLMVEVLTAGLCGTGRADKPADGGTPVFVQIINPQYFGSVDALKRETSWLAEACRASKPRNGAGAVRMPGDTAMVRRRSQLKSGIELHPSIMPALTIWAERLAVRVPTSKQS